MATMKDISEAIKSAGMDAATKSEISEAALPGGDAEKKTREDFDPEQLAAGKKVESEHTNDDAVAEEIAMDHLLEDPDYYKKLEKMENEGVDKAIFARFAARAKR